MRRFIETDLMTQAASLSFYALLSLAPLLIPFAGCVAASRVVLGLHYPSDVLGGWAAYLFSALVWPALLALEYQKGRPIQRQLQLVGAAEAFHLLFVLLTVYGGMAGLSFWANLLWVLLACARGWAALSLYKMQEEDA